MLHRHSIRLKSYDYAQNGAYFLTICVDGRQCLMGQIVSGTMQPSAVGQAVAEAWETLPSRFPDVRLDVFVVMPNHVHGILWIAGSGEEKDEGAASSAPTSAPTRGVANRATSLAAVMRAFKSVSAIAANRVMGRSGVPFWQRNYYEHVIRNDHDLDEIRTYIEGNPQRWDDDEYNLKGTYGALLAAPSAVMTGDAADSAPGTSGATVLSKPHIHACDRLGRSKQRPYARHVAGRGNQAPNTTKEGFESCAL